MIELIVYGHLGGLVEAADGDFVGGIRIERCLAVISGFVNAPPA